MSSSMHLVATVPPRVEKMVTENPKMVAENPKMVAANLEMPPEFKNAVFIPEHLAKC